MDGPAHEMNPHNPPLLKKFVESLRREPLNTRPEPNERFLRFLRLQAAEMGDGVSRRQVAAVKQQLPGERRAVE